MNGYLQEAHANQGGRGERRRRRARRRRHERRIDVGLDVVVKIKILKLTEIRRRRAKDGRAAHSLVLVRVTCTNVTRDCVIFVNTL